MKEIDDEVYNELVYLGILPLDDYDNVRDSNIGTSNYSSHRIQPWSVWLDWKLNPFDADIVKRVLRTKVGQSRKEDYMKIIHICEERIRQIEIENANSKTNS